ncbi:MAG: hypothetical protein U0166_02425 [Acidobacteriota bacterium]
MTDQPAPPVNDDFAAMYPLWRQDSRRILYRLSQERARSVRKAIGRVTVRLEPVWPGQDPRKAEQFVGLPAPNGWKREHTLEDGARENLYVPNLGGAEELDREIESYVAATTMPEDGPLFPKAADVEGWLTPVSSRERAIGVIFGQLPRFVLVNPQLDELGWFGCFVVLTQAEGPVTIFTSGIADPDPLGDERHRRDYELYMQVPKGSERWALNLLQGLVRNVIEKTEDHLQEIRARHHACLAPIQVPGMDRPFAFIMGLRVGLPLALPIAGGAAKIIPVTLIKDEEVAYGEEYGLDELAPLLVEGNGIVSDPGRDAVVEAPRKSRWKFW